MSTATIDSMSEKKNVKILAFVGLAGSGKSTAVEYLTAKGYPKVYFGGVVLDEVKKRELELTPDNEQTIRESLRESEGKDFVVRRIIEQISHLIDAGQHHIVADGLYTWTEYKILKHEFPGELNLIAIVAPRPLRHHRLTQRPVRPLTNEQADQRDWAEIENLEKGGPIAIADHFILNDGDLTKLHTQIDTELGSIDFYS